MTKKDEIRKRRNIVQNICAKLLEIYNICIHGGFMCFLKTITLLFLENLG